MPDPPMRGKMQVNTSPVPPVRHSAPVRTVELQVQSCEHAVSCAVQPPLMHAQHPGPFDPASLFPASGATKKLARLASGAGAQVPASASTSAPDPESAGPFPFEDDEQAVRPTTAARRPRLAKRRFRIRLTMATAVTPDIESPDCSHP
jgi:hypothetical protein